MTRSALENVVCVLGSHAAQMLEVPSPSFCHATRTDSLLVEIDGRSLFPEMYELMSCGDALRDVLVTLRTLICLVEPDRSS